MDEKPDDVSILQPVYREYFGLDGANPNLAFGLSAVASGVLRETEARNDLDQDLRKVRSQSPQRHQQDVSG